MKIKSLSFLAFLVVVSFISCKKDSSETPNILTGNYKFIKLVAGTVSAISYAEDEIVSKAVTYSEYTTKNNTGSLEINSRSIKSTGLSYSIDTTTRTDLYEDDELIDFFEAPFEFSISATESKTIQ